MSLLCFEIRTEKALNTEPTDNFYRWQNEIKRVDDPGTDPEQEESLFLDIIGFESHLAESLKSRSPEESKKKVRSYINDVLTWVDKWLQDNKTPWYSYLHEAIDCGRIELKITVTF